MNRFSRRLNPIVLAAMLCVSLASASWGATYYVAPGGNNASNGSQGSPWQSLSYACSKVTSAGDTISLAAGNYSEGSSAYCNLANGVNIVGAGVDKTIITTTYNGGNGTGYISKPSGNQITHGNNEISGFTLNGSNKTTYNAICFRGYDNLNMHDLKIVNFHLSAFWIEPYYSYTGSSNFMTPPPAYGQNITIHDCVIDNTTTAADLGWGPTYGAINISTTENAQLYNLSINENYPGNGDGFKQDNGWNKGFKGYNWSVWTDIHNGNAFTFEMYNWQGDSEIYNCHFYGSLSLNGGAALVPGSKWNLRIHDNIMDHTGIPSGSSLGDELSHNYLEYYNNYIINQAGRGAGLWRTLYLTANGLNDISVHNNVFYNCASGITVEQYGTMKNILIANNTFDTITGNPWGGYAIDGNNGFSGTVSNFVIRNNLIMNSQNAIRSYSGMTIDHNWLNAANPGVTKTGTKPAPYYTLTGTGSNLYDAGVDVGLPFTGKAPDLGAYELQSTRALNPPTNLTVQ